MTSPDKNSHKEHNSSHPPKFSILAWFASNTVAANIMMLFFIVSGVIAIFATRTETFPPIDPKIITITVPYPGATTFEVEEAITSRVEEAVTGIEGVKKISSSAYEAVGVITLELEDFVNGNEVLDDVKNEIDQIIDFPPEDAEEPQIIRVKPRPQVMTLAFYGDVDEKKLKYWAEKIEDDLVQTPNISLVSITGTRNYEIAIEISEKNLQQYNLTLEQIGLTVREFSRNIPAGTIEAKNGDILLRVEEKGIIGKNFENIVIKSLPDGSILRLKDIAQIRDGLEDTNLLTKYKGKQAVLIQVSRSSAQDALAVGNTVIDYLKNLKLPKGLKIDLVESRVEILRDRMSLLGRNAILGFVLVFFILLLFLDLKLAIWTSIGIPLSFLGGLLLSYMFGLSLNMVSLFALILVLGIVVDDAIVTGESIFQEQASGKKGVASSLAGVRAVIAPVTVGVITTMIAFAPLALTSGTLGQILSGIPIIVISILTISLFEAFLILPAHLASSTRWSVGIIADMRDKTTKLLEYFTKHQLLPLIKLALRWKYVSLAVFIGLLMIGRGLFLGDVARFVFFPNIESDQVDITLVMPVGTSFEVTKAKVDIIESSIAEVEKKLERKTGGEVINDVLVLIGSSLQAGGPARGGAQVQSSNRANIKIFLVKPDMREIAASEVAKKIRQEMGELEGIEELTFQSSLISDGKDVNLRISHKDEQVLRQATEELKSRMSEISGVVSISDNMKLGKKEYVFAIKPAGLAAGLTPSQLGRQLRHSFFGFEAQRVQRSGSELKIMVRYPENERDSVEALNNLRIKLPNGEKAALGIVANIKEQHSFSQINRINGLRSVVVTADTDISIITPNKALEVVTTRIMPKLQERYLGLFWDIEGRSKERKDDLAKILQNMGIALLVIFVLLSALLKSYIQPVIIMLAIPFAFIGALLGHLLLGYNLSFVSIFGLVALSGVVINDSVVLIDYYNTRRLKGDDVTEALYGAILRRFRPVLLTTMTTAIGLMPMLMETSLQAQFLIPMAVSLAFGLIFGTVVILFLVPVMISIAEDVKRMVK